MTDRHDWKHYLPSISLAGGNNIKIYRMLTAIGIVSMWRSISWRIIEIVILERNIFYKLYSTGGLTTLYQENFLDIYPWRNIHLKYVPWKNKSHIGPCFSIQPFSLPLLRLAVLPMLQNANWYKFGNTDLCIYYDDFACSSQLHRLLVLKYYGFDDKPEGYTLNLRSFVFVRH